MATSKNAGWRFAYPAYKTVGPCKHSAAGQYDDSVGPRKRSAAGQ
ncbi:hypothetical protein VPX56_16410 [Enterobacter wuhouensis]|uniref:Uncharacterized protein n=1 Tax=Enterobacter wuhouensis TaxID=2529381 RepID=A0ABZ1DCQ2_9ENTR|nr:hypothetical protein [Enterobacter wuhouensis]WRW30370.1 hypothetical protein VPX56_16410 [Enterobacter wuhouensis]